MADTKNTQANALLSLFVKLHSAMYGKPPAINRYKEKWAMVDVIESVGYERARQIVEYYFKVPRVNHPLQYFLFNFDRMDELMREQEEDKARREKLRLETKARVEEWEAGK